VIGAQQSTDDLLSQVRPITGPEAVLPPGESNAWIIGLALVAAVIIAVMAWRRWLRKPVTHSAHSAIHMALDQLPNTPSAEALASFDRICRRWLSLVHHVDGDHETGRALLNHLPQSVREEWSLVFAQLEPGRFSKQPLTATQWTDLVSKVRAAITTDIAGPVAR